MPREIKFRSWVKGESKMIYDFDELPNNALSETDEYILMQYTGLKDKNGKEIYEGDILESKYGGIGVVKYHKNWGAFYYSMVTGTDEYRQIVPMMSSDPFSGFDAVKKQYEKVGNIYENPELLPKE